MTVLRVIPGVGAAARKADFGSVRVVFVVICCFGAILVADITILLVKISWRRAGSIANILVRLMILRE